MTDLRVSPLVLWAASTYEDKAKHGYWMAGGSKPWTRHPTQLCNCSTMLCDPAYWLKFYPEHQNGPKCSDCLDVLNALLHLALLAEARK